MSYRRRQQQGGGEQQAGQEQDGRTPGRRTRAEGLRTARGYSRGEAGADDRQIAGAGEGAGERISFPHASTIQSTLGVSLPGSAVLNPGGCEDRGVPAFTDGATTHFASASAPLHVAAHEAAHQLQHAGTSRDAGMGAERHAHEVAESVTGGDAGRARSLVGGAGDAVPSGTRNYTEFTVAEQNAKNQWKVGSLARVGDQGRTVTTNNLDECWAEPALVAEANEILKAKKSGLELSITTPVIVGEAPDGSGWKGLAKVLTNKHGKDYWADCGRASREVQGPTGTDTDPRGVYTDGSGARKETAAKSSDPADFRDEIYVKGGLGSTPAAAKAAYLALSPADKDAFDKKHGINKYAAPGVGESFVARRDDDLTGEGFNWHWGAVIMVAGGDRVTFENFAKEISPGVWTDYESKDAKWYFETHGPASKPGQTFHEHNETSVGEPGMNTTTMATRTSPDPKEIDTLGTPELVKRYNASSEAGEKSVIESVMRKRWLKVHVKVVKPQEGPDEVYIKVKAGGRTFESGYRKLGSGEETTWWVSLDKLAPITGDVDVRVYDYDKMSADDIISHLGLTAPNYGRVEDKRPWDGAEYHTTTEFDR